VATGNMIVEILPCVVPLLARLAGNWVGESALVSFLAHVGFGDVGLQCGSLSKRLSAGREVCALILGLLYVALLVAA
jgi:hypothetical protein